MLSCRISKEIHIDLKTTSNALGYRYIVAGYIHHISHDSAFPTFCNTISPIACFWVALYCGAIGYVRVYWKKLRVITALHRQQLEKQSIIGSFTPEFKRMNAIWVDGAQRDAIMPLIYTYVIWLYGRLADFRRCILEKNEGFIYISKSYAIGLVLYRRSFRASIFIELISTELQRSIARHTAWSAGLSGRDDCAYRYRQSAGRYGTAFPRHRPLITRKSLPDHRIYQNDHRAVGHNFPSTETMHLILFILVKIRREPLYCNYWALRRLCQWGLDASVIFIILWQSAAGRSERDVTQSQISSISLQPYFAMPPRASPGVSLRTSGFRLRIAARMHSRGEHGLPLMLSWASFFNNYRPFLRQAAWRGPPTRTVIFSRDDSWYYWLCRGITYFYWRRMHGISQLSYIRNTSVFPRSAHFAKNIGIIISGSRDQQQRRSPFLRSGGFAISVTYISRATRASKRWEHRAGNFSGRPTRVSLSSSPRYHYIGAA